MKLLRVRQNLISKSLKDISGEVHRQLAALDLDVPQGEVAITVGSRGIANIPAIIRAAGDWLKSKGAAPFIVPAMGSHNGATAEGQQQMIESLGITESAMEMPIRSSMECIKLGQVSTGNVWMDKHCAEAAGVLVVNRVKLHTCFSGPVQSGITKMMVVGMGKIQSAQTFHSAASDTMKQMLLEMGQCLLDSKKIFAGLAILEDGFDETAELHAMRAEDILQQEPSLLKKHIEYFPALPVDELSALVVGEIGKTYSGTGMDTNVIGYRGVRGGEDLAKPNIAVIAALRLAAASQGNAIGVGLADFITEQLRSEIDERKTFINVYTTGDMRRGAIPMTMESDRALLEAMQQRYGARRWIFVPNTLYLGRIYASADLRDELESHPNCEIVDEVEWQFEGDALAMNYDF